METAVIADERGRVTLGKDVADKYGKKFAMVKMPGEIVLIPIPDDPLKSLQEEGKKIPAHMSVKDLKRIALEEATKEAMGNLKYTENQKLWKNKRR